VTREPARGGGARDGQVKAPAGLRGWRRTARGKRFTCGRSGAAVGGARNRGRRRGTDS
jgi:hypothetical protein